MKEFKEKLAQFMNSLPDDATGGSLNWTKDEVNYSLSFSAYGGSINLTYNAYKQTPPNLPHVVVAQPAKEHNDLVS